MTNIYKTKLINKSSFIINILISIFAYYLAINKHPIEHYNLPLSICAMLFSAYMFYLMIELFSEQISTLKTYFIFNLVITIINMLMSIIILLICSPHIVHWSYLFRFELFYFILSLISTEILVSILYHYRTKILIISNNKSVPRFINKLMRDYYLYGEIQNFNVDEQELLEGYNLIDSSDGILLLNEIDENIKEKYIDYSLKHKKSINVVPSYDKICYVNSKFSSVGDTPIIVFDAKNPLMAEMLIKRIFDIFFSLFLLILTSPLFLILSILIKIISPGTIFYKQERYTINKKTFNIYKFRTMYMDAEKNGAKYAKSEDDRITSIGKFMRATRLDELPQLINILKGEMSVVGPRPERPIFSDEYSKIIKDYDIRFEMKAGLTGYAQICGKYNTRISDKQLFDIIYIRNFSLLLDLKILIRTIFVVFTKEATEGIDTLSEILPKLMQNTENSKEKKISIVIPSYNSAKYINQCIDSVLNQKCNVEIIVVNDGSTDNTDEKVAKYGDSIIYVKTKNKGQAAARNEGLIRASGDYIMFLDSDDYLKPNSLHELINIAENGNIDIVHFGYCNFTDKDNYLGYPKELFLTNNIVYKNDFKKYIYTSFINGINLNSVCFELYKTNLIKGLRFDESLVTAEDCVFNLSAYTKAKSVIGIPNTYYYYRQTGTGLTGSHITTKDKYKYNILFGDMIIYNYLRIWGMDTFKWRFKSKCRIIHLTFDKLNRLRLGKTKFKKRRGVAING